MRCLKLTIAYRGTRYCGWQIQNGQNSIQQELESAFNEITGEARRIIASGRTDSGVHALGQVASVQTTTAIDCDRLRLALNSKTPKDISVLEIEEAPLTFHAIRDAKRKRYRYRIQPGRVADPLEREFCWHYPLPLDQQAMRKACEFVVGEHDFACFQATGAERKSTVRTIYCCELNEECLGPLPKLILEVEGNGFLYNMVRNIVGSLVEVGRGRYPPSWLKELIAGQDRTQAGPTAPPEGLFLIRVEY